MITAPNKNYLIAILVFLIVPISGLSIDIYVPSLPAIVTHFQTDKALAQLTLTTYMLGAAIMQLFAGPLSDYFGRKKPYIISMLTYIIATLLIPLSSSIHALLFLRFIQGIAIACISVPMRAVIADLFTGRELYKMGNYMTMSWSIGPIIAPAIGGYLQHFFGWQACFYFLAIYSIIVFILSLIFIPETSQHKHPLHLLKILARYREMIMHWEYTKTVFTNGLLYSLIILFAIVGPFLIQNVLHYSAIDFGHIALLVGLAWFMGTVFNRFLVDMKNETKTTLGYLSLLFISITMTILSAVLPLGIYQIVIPMILIALVSSMLFSHGFARRMSLFTHLSASSNALAGSLVFLIPSVISSLGTLLKSNSAFPLAAAYVVIILLSFTISAFRFSKQNQA
jgi:DHA1 family bicyclomycin/chloramphenicol resistance-like MFS transporter